MRDEYFCPNCNAILNDQYGFDPNKGSWTCTECGEHLMDDDVYDGDTFEGVAWYCDDCGALLNRQSGFHDYYGSWTCTECGHWNSISEDEITNNNNSDSSDDTYEYDSSTNTYSSNSYHYNSSRSTNEDDEFSQFLEKFAMAIFKFIVWIIKLIGKLIVVLVKGIYTLIKKIIHYFIDPQENGRISRKDFAWIRIKAFFRDRKHIQIDRDSYLLWHKSLDSVKTILYNNGFKRIKTIPIKDIDQYSKYRVNEVEQVVINGISYFEQDDIFSYNAEIIITYHDKKEIVLPFPLTSFRRKNHKEVKAQLFELGFVNIIERPIYDITTGWITKDGMVDNVIIKSNDNWNMNGYKYDEQVIIEYHSTRKLR
jgi:DNA-directed RNA polymerase subunit M/transcription elongation factor TFIIS